MPETRRLLEKSFQDLWKRLLVVGGILIALTLVVGWFGDHRSCLRQVELRENVIEQREINRRAIVFWERQGEPAVADRLRERVRSQEDIHPLDCTKILPGV